MLCRRISAGHPRLRTHTSQIQYARWTLYCEVDASYLLHPDSKGHTGYNISFYGTIIGTFHNCSVKHTAVATLSTHTESRAIFTLAKKLIFINALCQELRIPLELPAIIMEDNSVVVTMVNSDTGYTKKCKHFLMVLNYIKEQIALGQIEARKIYGKLNVADMHTKPLRFIRQILRYGAQDPRPPPATISFYSTEQLTYTYPYLSCGGNSVILRHGCRGPTEHRDEIISAA